MFAPTAPCCHALSIWRQAQKALSHRRSKLNPVRSVAAPGIKVWKGGGCSPSPPFPPLPPFPFLPHPMPCPVPPVFPFSPFPTLVFPSLPIPLHFPIPFPSPSLPRSGPLNPTRGSGERCKLPQRGLGRSPSRNRIWCILALKSDTWWQIILFIFLRIN